MLNPWDDIFHEFHITQCGWTFIEQKVDGNAALAAAVVEAEAHAEMHVTKWREDFVGTVEALHVLRTREAKDKKAAEDAKRPPLATRVWTRAPKTLGAGVGLVTWTVVSFYKFVTWAVKLYMAAHMFFRAFLADPFSSFSGRGGIETMHSTDVESPPPPPPRVCMSIHPEGKSWSDIGSSACSQRPSSPAPSAS